VIGSLLVIIFLAYMTIRLLGRKTGAFGGHPLIRLVHSQALGPNKSVHAIVVDEKTVLLIGSGSTLETLARFDDEELAKRLLLPAHPMWQTRKTVPAILAALGNRMTSARKGTEQDREFSLLVKKRLNDLSDKRAQAFSELSDDDTEGSR